MGPSSLSGAHSRSSMGHDVLGATTLLVASQVNDGELPEQYYPLRLVGIVLLTRNHALL